MSSVAFREAAEGTPSKNADLLRRLRADAVARGLCMSCRARQPRAGVKTCNVCLDRRKDAVLALEEGTRAARPRGPRYTDVGASGLSKPCSNVDKCELWMNLGSPYSVPGRTSVTTWSATGTYPSGSAFASATWDPYP
jgi:hypothetical protein